jgi:hypothetical protein
MDTAMEIIEPIKRSPDGLREALYSELESLRSGSTTVTRARAVGKLAEEIHKSIRLEIEHQDAIDDQAFALSAAIIAGDENET